MLALVLDGEPRLVPDRPPPERRPGEARVAVLLAGICDTDLQLVRGYMGYRGVLGHEFVGEVIESDSHEWLGKRVVADINAGCGACADCVYRDGHHCRRRDVLGILGRDGALAEQVVVPERCLVEVPASLEDERAVFAEPLAAAAHVLDARPPRAGERAVVLGDGKLGLLCALVLMSEGLRVSLVGHHRHKLEIAAKAGVSTVLEEELEAGELSAPLVVEASGSERGLAQAIALCEPRGTLVLKSTVAARSSLDLAPVVVNELTIVGSRCGDVGLALGLLAGERIDPRPLIEARLPLSRGEEALSRAARPGALKVLIEARM